MLAKTKTEIKFVAGFAMSLVALLVLMILSYQTTKKLVAAEDWVAHTHEVIAELDSVESALLDIEAAHRGYLLSGNSQYLVDQQTAVRNLPDQLKHLDALIADNPVQQKALNQLEFLIAERVQLLPEPGADGGAAMARSQAVLNQIRQSIAQMRAREVQLREQRRQASTASAQRSLAVIATGGVALCILGLLATVMFWHDFNLRRHAEDVLRQSEERARLMVESIRDYALIMLDPGGRVVQWNEGARRIKGYEAGEIIGQHFSRFYPDELVRSGFPGEALARAAAEGRFETEGWRVRKDGSRFWASVSISAMRNSRNELRGFVKVTRDLTEREQARQELQASRAQLQSILDNSPAMVYVKDLEGRYLFVNQLFASVYGRPREEIIGKTAFDISVPELARAAEEHHRRILETQSPIEVESTVIYPDGPHPHQAIKFPLREVNGRIYATAGISTDITERKRAEQVQKERDRFFDLTSDLICIAGFDGYFKTLNPSWENVLGFSRTELMAAPFMEFVHPDDRMVTKAEAARLAEGGETVNFENRYRCKDGSYRWFTWSARAAMPQNLIYAAGRDTTQQRAAQEKLVQLNEELQRHTAEVEAANKELEAFSYSVSHDLRAPVRHIDGFVKMLEKHAGSSLDEQGQRYLHIIGDAAHQMGLLIDDLLVFSRMGRTDLRPARVETNSLIDDAIAGLQTEIGERNIEWQIDRLPGVWADAAMLRQVWINLIANAVKYSRPRNPARIQIGEVDSDERETVFFVRDNGVGFDMQYRDKLFGVFQRLHRAEEFEGTGIGLANVRRIVGRHGGRTWAEGVIDEGATFYFSLPKTLNFKSNHKTTEKE